MVKVEVNLNEVKDYLRVETIEEDKVIEVLMGAAISHCETIIKRPILSSNMNSINTWKVPESIRIAIYLLISHWYENRAAVGQITEEVAFSVNAILKPHRFWNV